MCSLVDGSFLPVEDDDTSSIGGSSTTTTDLMCKKCRVVEPQLTLRKKDGYCAECFLASSRHKFRATLGKHKIMKLDESVLVSFQGNQFDQGRIFCKIRKLTLGINFNLGLLYQRTISMSICSLYHR